MSTCFEEQQIISEPSEVKLFDAFGEKPCLVASCMDYNYCQKVRHPLRSYGVHLYNSLTFAGSVHMLCKPKNVPYRKDIAELIPLYNSARKIFRHSISLGVKFHKVNNVLLTTHARCGHLLWEGYDFSANPEAEKEKHEADRQEAAEWVHSHIEFSDLNIWTAFFYRDDQGLVQIDDLKQVF